MSELSTTWVVISIGNRKYVINTIYVQSIVELSNQLFKQPDNKSSFIKGIYDIHGAVISVLDGRKIVCETTVDEKKIQFANKINYIICSHMAWIDSIEWEILTSDDINTNIADLELAEFIREYKPTDVKIQRVLDKIKSQLSVVHSMADKALISRKCGDDLGRVMGIIKEIRRQSDNYIIKNLQKIIDTYNQSITEMCIVLKTKNITFGLSIDSVMMVTERVDGMKNTEKTRLSAGQLKIKGEVYNILNLSKLAKVV